MPSEPKHSNQPIPYPDTDESRHRRGHARYRTQLSALSDESLIELSLAGEDSAFEALLHRYSSVVAGYLYGKIPAGVDAEDLAQEIFLSAHQNLDRLRNRRKFGPWLMKIARHRLFDLARERKRPETAWQRMESPEPHLSVLDHVASEAPNPAEDAADAEARAQLEAAIGALQDTYRVVVYLRLIDNLPPHLISVRLGISGAATRVRLHRGLDKLRGELARRGIEPGAADTGR